MCLTSSSDYGQKGCNHNCRYYEVQIGAIVMILGVGVPLFLNNRNEKYIEKLLSDAKQEAISAKEQAEKAEKALNSIQPQVESIKEQVASATEQAKQAKQAKHALAEIENLKQHVDGIETRINKDAETAKEAAKEAEKSAKINQLYAQATKEENPEKAIDIITQAMKLDPNNASLYCFRGSLKEGMKDKEGALSDYDKAISINPDFEYAYYCRGYLKKENDPQGALDDFNKAISLDPDDHFAYLHRSKCFRNLAETEEDPTKKAELIAKAEADEKKAESLK